MKGDNVVAIIKSTAFTILVATFCGVVLINQIPVVYRALKREKDDY